MSPSNPLKSNALGNVPRQRAILIQALDPDALRQEIHMVAFETWMPEFAARAAFCDNKGRI